MQKNQGIKVVSRMRSKGFTLAGWCRANGFNRRTVNDILFAGLGSIRGGKKHDEIISALKRDAFILAEESH